MTERQENAVINMVDKFFASKLVREITEGLSKQALTDRLEKVMRSSFLNRNKEMLDFAIATMIEKVEAL